jgi:aldehyde dehydrogenase (NAD+)
MISSKIIARKFATQASIKPRVTQLLIDGKFVNSMSGKTFDTINPATEEKLASVQEADVADIDKAVKAARKAFDEGPWRRMNAADRGKLMYKLADLIDKHSDELSTLEALDNGKPKSFSKNVDIALSAACIRYYAGWTDKIHGKTIPIAGPYFCYSREEPVGVCAQIIPWNFPTLMQAWKLGPALATGNTIVMKPAE